MDFAAHGFLRFQPPQEASDLMAAQLFEVCSNPIGCLCQPFIVPKHVPCTTVDHVTGAQILTLQTADLPHLHPNKACRYSIEEQCKSFLIGSIDKAHAQRPKDIEVDGVCTGACRFAQPWSTYFDTVIKGAVHALHLGFILPDDMFEAIKRIGPREQQQEQQASAEPKKIILNPEDDAFSNEELEEMRLQLEKMAAGVQQEQEHQQQQKLVLNPEDE